MLDRWRGRGAPRVLGREVAVFGAFAVLTLAMTWPWITHLRDAVPDPGDPYIMSWVLWWDFHQTFHDPLHLFQGNIFFPYVDTLAFSESCYGIALPLFPLFALGIRPLTAHSLATLLGFTLSGYGAFRMSRTLTGSTGAAWVSGIAFAFLPYRFYQLAHLPYLFAGWMPLLLEALVLFLRKRSRGRALWLGIAFLMNALTSIHWFVLSLIPLLVTGVVLGVRNGLGKDPAGFRRGAVALAASALCLLPFLLPYRRVTNTYHLVRYASESARYSARPIHWLTPSPTSKVWTTLGDPERPLELCLFPGLLVLGLAFTAVVLAATHSGSDERRFEMLAVGVIWSVLGFVGSLGMNTVFHRTLFATFSLFRSIRAPARWAMVGDVGLALLAGVGALSIVDRMKARGVSMARAGPALYLVASAVLLFENRSAPLDLVHGEKDPDELTLLLARTPMRGGIVTLPSTNMRSYLAVLQAADHGKPLVTAVSGFEPPLQHRIEKLSRRDPVPDELLDLFERIPTSYLAIRESGLEGSREAMHVFLAKGLASGRLRFVGRFGNAKDDLYVVTRTEPDAAAGGSPPWRLSESLPKQQRVEPEDSKLTGSVDGPVDAEVVTGPLRVHGWARIPGQDLEVTILIDGEDRVPLSRRRTPRLDVGSVVTTLGDCSGAGYEAVYERLAGDVGRHELVVIFRASGGHVRHYPARHFEWR